MSAPDAKDVLDHLLRKKSSQQELNLPHTRLSALIGSMAQLRHRAEASQLPRYNPRTTGGEATPRLELETERLAHKEPNQPP